MRKSSEAIDEDAVPVGVRQHVLELGGGGGQAREKSYRLVLHGQALGMLERHVDEGTHERRQAFILTRADH